MGYTVTHEGGTTDSEYAEYVRLLSRLLLKQGVSLDNVPRVPEDGTPGRWLFVWDNEEEARAFLDQLRQQTRDSNWRIQAVAGPPSLGPLQPIEVQVTRRQDGWAFALAPLTERAIQLRFPGSCVHDSVLIGSENGRDSPKGNGNLRELTEQVLPILTGLRNDRLQAFGSYRVVDPVADRILIGPIPVKTSEGGPD